MADNGNGTTIGKPENENNLGVEYNNSAIQAGLAAGTGSSGNNSNNENGSASTTSESLGLENSNSAIKAAQAAAQESQEAQESEPSITQEAIDEEEAEPRIGDFMRVVYKVGDAELLAEGEIYTINESVIRILVSGSSTRLHTFELQKDEDGILEFKDTLVGAPQITPRSPPVRFVEYLGLAQDKRVQLYKNGEVVKGENDDPKVFVVKAVNTSGENDKVTLVNVADASETLELDFSEGGIPTTYDAEFDLIFVLGDKEPEVTQEQLFAAAEAATDGSAPPGQGEYEDVDDISTFLNSIVSTEEAQREGLELQRAEGKQLTEEDQIESFLRGLLMDLPYEQQKNPVIRKRIETLVQAFNLLRKSLLVPNTQGELEPRPLTIDRLADALRNTKMPIARPIYNSTRIVVTENTESSLDERAYMNQIKQQNLQETLGEYNTHMESEKSRAQTVVEEPGQEQLPRFYSFLQELNKIIPLGDELYGGTTPIRSDTDFFRHPIPDLEESSLYGLTTIEMISEKTGKKETPSNYDPSDFITELKDFSLRRALAKQSEGELLETPKTEGYVVFPVEASSQGIVGAKRSGRLVETIKRSQMPKIPMRYALNKEFYGPIDKLGRNLAKAVYYDELLDDGKQTNGADSIQFNEYLDTILKTIFLEGPADMNPLKLDLGIEEFELTVDQMNLVRQRILTILDKLTMYIGSLGKSVEELQKLPKPTDNSLFSAQVTRYENLAKLYEPLGKVMAALKDQNINYSRIDIAIVAHCLRHIPDYFFAVLTQGVGSKEKIEQEQIRLEDNSFKEEIHNIIQQQQYDRDQKIQYGPQRKVCGATPQESHYFIMDIVRRRGDFKLRMKAMEQAISTFLETKRSDNWYHCIQCKDNLICQHEYLQYLQYKNPQDYASIQKQIILDFAGGSFGSNYICRNCGLPIADIGFDIKTELREGTSIDIDLDEKKRQEQERKLMGIFESIEDGRTGDQVYDDLQVAAKKLFERFDIEYSKELFRIKLFPRANFCIQRAMTEKEFVKTKGKSQPAEEEEEEEKEEEEEGKKEVPEQKGGAKEGNPTEKKTAGKKLAAKGKKTVAKKQAPKKIDPDYQIYKTRTMLCALGAAILVELQTAIPELRIEGSDASDVFTGYPLDSREKEPTIGYKLRNGVSIMINALLILPRNEKPWNTLGLKGEQTPEEMFMELKPMMEAVLTTLVTQNTTVETDIRIKRKHIADVDLEARQKNERLPSNFLPLLQTLAEGQEQGASEPTVEVGAKGAIGNTLKAAKWIREANRYAQKTGRSILGQKFMEGSCCEVEGSVTEPGKFWMEHHIEPMPKRDSFPFQSPYRRNTVLNVPFESDALYVNEMKPAEEAKFNLFLTVCAEGDNVGKPHELDYMNVCDWCGLRVDEKFLMPPTDVDKGGNIIPYTPDEIQQIYNDLRDKGITGEGSQFEELLQQTYRLAEFTQYTNPEFISPLECIDKLLALDPAPTSLETLRVDSSQPEKKNEVGTWAKWVTNYFKFVKEEDKLKIDSIKRLSFMEGENVKFFDKEVASTLNLRSTYSKYEPKQSSQSTTEGDGKNITTNPREQFAKLIQRAPPSEKINFLREYCLVPALRLKNAFQSKSLKVVDFYYKLKNPELVKLLNTILEKHSQQYMNLREQNEEIVAGEEFTDSLDTLIDSSKSALDIANSTLLLPSQTQNEIWNAILSAILYDFLNTSTGSAKILADNLINGVLSQYQVEKNVINTENILIEMDKLKEVEKQWFIKFLDGMTPEMRKVELTKKKLGIGELWSKGGTSLTHKYNPEEWNNLAEAAKQRGTYEDAVNGDLDGALGEMSAEAREAADLANGYSLGFEQAEGEEGEIDT